MQRAYLSLLVFQVVVLPLPASPVAFAGEAALGMTPDTFVFVYLG